MKTTVPFDSVADDYADSVAALPDEYCQLIAHSLNVNSLSRCLELGCGTGLLTDPLASVCFHVDAVDISSAMLAQAVRRSLHKNITWIRSDVHTFQPERAAYDAVCAYETFHLFSDPRSLLLRFSDALKVGGRFGIGWCEYCWERELRDLVTAVFNSHGIQWGEWGYQSCESIRTIVEDYKPFLSSLEVRTTASHEAIALEQVATYLSSIEKASKLSPKARSNLRNGLLKAFQQRLKTREFEGVTVYTIAFFQKTGEQR